MDAFTISCFQHTRDGLRSGQALMLAIQEHYPEYYKMIFKTNLDCFYSDAIILDTLVGLSKWKGGR